MDKIVKKDNEVQNPFFSKLIALMKNNEFRDFYNTYFTDWNEIQSMVFFMKLYSTIEYEYRERFNENINDNEMSLILTNVMNNNVTRRYALDLFQEFKSTIDYKKTKQFRMLLTFNKPLDIRHGESGASSNA